MEELKKELEKLSKAYVDTPENEEKILIPFVKRLLELPMKERRKLLPVIREGLSCRYLMRCMTIATD